MFCEGGCSLHSERFTTGKEGKEQMTDATQVKGQNSRSSGVSRPPLFSAVTSAGYPTQSQHDHLAALLVVSPSAYVVH